MSSEPAPRPSTRSAVIWWVVIAAAAFAAMAAGYHVLDRLSTGAVDGELRVRAHGGVFSMRPDTCTSGYRGEGGDEDSFFGVHLYSERIPERLLRIEHHRDHGTQLTIITREGPAPVDVTTCVPFDVDLRSTNARVYDVVGISGHANVHCEQLQGEVVFERCY